jgi:hypothetical protein
MAPEGGEEAGSAAAPPQPLGSGPAHEAAFGSVPAAAVIAECVRVQREVPVRSAAARFFGRSPLSEESRPWYAGALGEIDVARRLERLGPEWTVLHAVPIGTRGSDIDHLVVGPTGVFTINTKFHEDAKVWVGSRRLLVNGQPKDHLRNARHEADRVSKLLTSAIGDEVKVRAVIAIVAAKEITIREQPADVTVVRAGDLARWLRRHKPLLQPERVAEIARTVRRRETWTSAAETPVDAERFAALQREVSKARGVRVLWSLGGLLALLGVTVPFALNAFAGLLGT